MLGHRRPEYIRTRAGSPQWRLWKELEPRLARLDPKDPVDVRIANLIVHLFRDGALGVEGDADPVVESYRVTRERLGVDGRRIPGVSAGGTARGAAGGVACAAEEGGTAGRPSVPAPQEAHP